MTNGHQAPMPVASIDAQRLAEKLATVPIGETITYTDLSKVIGRDVTDKARHLLSTARRISHRTKSMVFAPVQKVGLMNVTDETKVAMGADFRPVRRLLRRKARILAAVKDYAKLGPDAKRDHNTGLAMLGSLELMTRSPEIKRVASAVETIQRALTFDETLRLFAGGK